MKTHPHLNLTRMGVIKMRHIPILAIEDKYYVTYEIRVL